MGPSAAAPHGTSIVLQEMQLIAQLEEQLQAETKEIKVACRGEGIGAACPLVGTWKAPSRPSPHLTRVMLYNIAVGTQNIHRSKKGQN